MTKPKTARSPKPGAPPSPALFFPDAGLHIAVLGALVDAELVSESAVEKHAKGVAEELARLDEDDMNGRLRLVLRRLHTFPLAPTKVAKIEALDFDGGNIIYMSLEEIAGTYSGGETDVYSLVSLAGISALKGLTRLDLDAHGNPPEGKANDLAHLAGLGALEEIVLGDCENADVLLSLPKLRRVRILGSRAEVKPASVLRALEEKGVVVERL